MGGRWPGGRWRNELDLAVAPFRRSSCCPWEEICYLEIPTFLLMNLIHLLNLTPLLDTVVECGDLARLQEDRSSRKLWLHQRVEEKPYWLVIWGLMKAS